MNKLESALLEIGVDSIAPFSEMTEQRALFCEQNEQLFIRVIANKPDSPVTNHLLGISTKCHIEQSALLERHLTSIKAMQSSFEANLGKQNASKFNNQSVEQLLFTSHIWLYVQGYLDMDFSLANDHAENTAYLLTSATGINAQEYRTQLAESFYQGRENSPTKTQTNAVLSWFKALFSFS
jgi:hypothetical protein